MGLYPFLPENPIPPPPLPLCPSGFPLRLTGKWASAIPGWVFAMVPRPYSLKPHFANLSGSAAKA